MLHVLRRAGSSWAVDAGKSQARRAPHVVELMCGVIGNHVPTYGKVGRYLVAVGLCMLEGGICLGFG